jgi:hypothetical protein
MIKKVMKKARREGVSRSVMDSSAVDTISDLMNAQWQPGFLMRNSTALPHTRFFGAQRLTLTGLPS